MPGTCLMQGVDGCSNVTREGRKLCDTCVNSSVSIEDIQAAETMLDRVLTGGCQNCGKKEGCTCNFIG